MSFQFRPLWARLQPLAATLIMLLIIMVVPIWLRMVMYYHLLLLFQGLIITFALCDPWPVTASFPVSYGHREQPPLNFLVMLMFLFYSTLLVGLVHNVSFMPS